ncbi:MAG: hypothetical protein ABI664_20755 [bacterium]
MTQIIRTVTALRDRLGAVYTDANELSHTAPTHPTKNSFLTGMRDVMAVMVHEIDGAVERSRSSRWVNDYGKASGSGGGPQLVVWNDGTVMSLVELPYITTHGNFQNHRCIGVESGHGNDGRYGDTETAPNLNAGGPSRNGWVELSRNAEDVGGSTSVRYYRKYVQNAPAGFTPEVVVAPWATTNYVTPAREQPGTNHPGMYNTLIRTSKIGAAAVPPVPTLMVFPEAQYRSWALLARYLCEALLVPRNFPVLPHARSDHMTADIFKRLVLADQNYDQILAGLQGRYHGVNLAFTGTDFTDPAQVASLRTHFGRKGDSSATPPVPFVAPEMDQGTISGLVYVNSPLNLAWLRLFDFYRGIHGHGFSGNSVAGQDDHDCPGPMFDWHRFAREVWDWWWYPFDFDAAHTTTAVPERGYRRADGNTPLVEYFFNETTAPYTTRAAAPGGIQGPRSSPSTFRMEQDARVYALANGELVAARFPNTAAGHASMAFALLRHEVWHTLDPQIAPRPANAPDAANGGVPDAGRLDYIGEPSIVYSLHMHLGRPTGMSFTDVVDANPDWLNRALIRKKECELTLPTGAAGPLNAALTTTGIKPIPEADFTAPPGNNRPTPIAAWRMDLRKYNEFFTSLAAGDIAIAPMQVSGTDTFAPTPIRVILGDSMGVAGVIRVSGGVSTLGTRVEVFTPAIVDRAFTPITNQTDWNVAATVVRPALTYQSEWARTPTAAEAAALTALGVDPALVNWWTTVAQTHAFDVRLPAAARLPMNGQVVHYDPVTFMKWINDLTWASEWPKYRIAGALQQPRSRLV